MQIHFIRHIAPDVAQGICYGQLDVALPTNYQEQHNAIINTLNTNYDAVYCSPLLRCKLLGNAVSANTIFDKRLMEVNFGTWEGKAWDAIDDTELNYWMQNYITVAPPHGESLKDVVDRCHDFFAQLKTNTQHKKVLVISHAGFIRSAMHVLQNTPLTQIMMEKVAYGEIIKMEQ
jgi:alpha-ribazole phosphatase